MIRALGLILIAGTAVVNPAQSQSREGSESGRIRLILVNSNWNPIVGTAVSIGRDTVRLVRDGQSDTATVLVSSLDRIEWSVGRRSRLGRGILIGGLVGGAAGAAILATGDASAGSESTFGSAAAPVGFAAGGLLGAIIGGVSGSLARSDRWESMPMVTVAPASLERTGGSIPVQVGVSMRMSF